jgi:choline dehydrogenase-like flavoprotein
VDLLGISTTRADLFGAPLQSFMATAVKRFATMTAVVEDLPVVDNRVQLADKKDRFGVPLALVTHNADSASRALWQSALVDGKAVFEAAGSRETWTGPAGSMHIMGGTIMGSDPSTSVTNSFGQCHEVANLFVAGPGLFPTSGGVNPTFTAEALALRSARYILKNALN